MTFPVVSVGWAWQLEQISGGPLQFFLQAAPHATGSLSATANFDTTATPLPVDTSVARSRVLRPGVIAMWAARITAALLIAIASNIAAVADDQMPWLPSLEAAQQVAARTNRLVLIHFWAPWCQPCMRLEREVFSKPET